MQMKVQTNVVYEYLQDSVNKITVMQGGTRSGKTYNIAIWNIINLLNQKDKVLTVARLTMPSLKNTVFRDYKEILSNMGLWNNENFNKTDMVYNLNGNIIEFRNLDDDQKVRGAKRNYLHINEANEIPREIFMQLMFRTTEKIIMDYNPSDEFHYIYDEVITRDDCDFLKTTYKDNPFLENELVAEIERLKEIDNNYWRIYGLGEKGVSEATIFTNWDLTSEKEPDGEVYYGLDFGYNHPTSLIKVVINDDLGFVWSKELLYKSRLTNNELISEMKQSINDRQPIYGDSARPEMIKEIHRAGFNIHPTKKGKDSVKDGIDYMKRFKLKVTKDSLNLIKELKSYKWQVDKNGIVLDEPVKINDDAVDALRYAFNNKIKFKKKSSLILGTTNIYG